MGEGQRPAKWYRCQNTDLEEASPGLHKAGEETAKEYHPQASSFPGVIPLTESSTNTSKVTQ